MTVLNEKAVPYAITYIDLRNKPDWFLALSPTGKVPVVQTPDGDILFESAVINEYLDDVHAPHWQPAAPLARAQTRMWTEFMGALYGDVYQLYTTPDADRARAIIAGITTKLARLEDEIVGPLWQGEQFSLVDATAAPVFMRLAWVERLRPDLSAFTGLPRTRAWCDGLLARPSVREAVLPDIFDIFLTSVQASESWLAPAAKAVLTAG